MPHGWVILDKPVGLGSTQAVAAVKRNLREAGFGKKVKVGPQIDRHHAAAEGGPSTLTDPDLYKGNRSFTRVEPPPPPPE